MGIIEEVLRPLMSGKEAEVYLVLSAGERRVAKVYKEAHNRTFKHRSEYTEGRAVRNTRDQRAISKRTRHGRAQDEAAWRSTEVDMIYRLRNAGVRVPVPHHFIDGVLIMELVSDAEGNPAPRLGELTFERAEVLPIFERLLVEVIRMLCAGVVHGDLSDFNVLMGADGPVIIDFPQAVDASSNQNARKLLLRDVDNLHRFMQRTIPDWQARPYAHEMWELYKRNQLSPDTRLGGRFRPAETKANTDAVLALIGDADHDERRRREALGLAAPRGTSTFVPRRVEVVMTPTASRGPARPANRNVPAPDANRRPDAQRSANASSGPRPNAAPRWNPPANNPPRQDHPVAQSTPRPHQAPRWNPNEPRRDHTAPPASPRPNPAPQWNPVPPRPANGPTQSASGPAPDPNAPPRSRRRRRRRGGAQGPHAPNATPSNASAPRHNNAPPASETSPGPRKWQP